MYPIRARNEATNTRTIFLFLIFVVGFGSNTCHAADSDSLVFYPPFIVADIASLVNERQKALRVSQFHTMIFVQYGTRTEWINACSWLKAQTSNARSFYRPVQEGTAENQYFCAVSETDDGAPQESLIRIHKLISDLTQQFGGAAHRWTFQFGDSTEPNPELRQ